MLKVKTIIFYEDDMVRLGFHVSALGATLT